MKAYVYLYYSIFLISCSLAGMAHWQQRLMDAGAWYKPTPAPDAPLDDHLVMNDLWVKIKQENDQTKKDEALKEYALKDYSGNHWQVQRYQIAGAVAAGANPNVVNTADYCALVCAIQKNDYALVRKLLDNKADPNLKDRYFGDYPLWAAKTVAMAGLLVAKGADPLKKNSWGCTLLHNVVVSYDRSCDPDLITFYKSLGTPDTVAPCGQTALEMCFFKATEDKRLTTGKPYIEELLRAFFAGGTAVQDLQNALDCYKSKVVERSQRDSQAAKKIEIATQLIEQLKKK